MMSWQVSERLDPIAIGKLPLPQGHGPLSPSAYWRALQVQPTPAPLHRILPMLQRTSVIEAGPELGARANADIDSTAHWPEADHSGPQATYKQWLSVTQEVCRAVFRLSSHAAHAQPTSSNTLAAIVDLTPGIPQRKRQQAAWAPMLHDQGRSCSPARAQQHALSARASALTTASNMHMIRLGGPLNLRKHPSCSHAAAAEGPASSQMQRHQRVMHPSMKLDARMHNKCATELEQRGDATPRERITAVLQEVAAVLQVLALLTPTLAQTLLQDLVECALTQSFCGPVTRQLAYPSQFMVGLLSVHSAVAVPCMLGGKHTLSIARSNCCNSMHKVPAASVASPQNSQVTQYHVAVY